MSLLTEIMDEVFRRSPDIGRIEVSKAAIRDERWRLLRENRLDSTRESGVWWNVLYWEFGWFTTIMGIPVRVVEMDEPFRLLLPRDPLIFGASA